MQTTPFVYQFAIGCYRVSLGNGKYVATAHIDTHGYLSGAGSKRAYSCQVLGKSQRSPSAKKAEGLTVALVYLHRGLQRVGFGGGNKSHSKRLGQAVRLADSVHQFIYIHIFVFFIFCKNTANKRHYKINKVFLYLFPICLALSSFSAIFAPIKRTIQQKIMATKKYPLGIQTFSEIAKGNYYYADKTDVVYRLAHYAKFHFLSRPRRFGKSLLVSTLQAYFEGKKELFKGLAIEKLEQEWTEYPVLHFDISQSKYFDADTVKKALNALLVPYEERYGLITDKEESNSNRLSFIIKEAARQTGKQVVILIDEYDAPMHDSTSDKALQGKIRNIMRDFFSPLKKQEGDLRFVLITGISKFSQLSIFSELNNLKILSMKDEYSDICGFTKEQLVNDFNEGIVAMAEHNNMSVEQTVEGLKEHYDGYHFTPNCPDLFNPYSIINALDDKDFNSYWFTSGTPTFLIELLQKNGIDMLQLDNLWARDSRFDAPTDTITDPIPVLYQSGYLTIKEYNRKLRMYRLGFPNEEVRQGFSESLYRYYAPTMMGELDTVVYKYREKVDLEDDMEAFLPYLQTFYDKFPYTIINNNERHYQAVMFTIFAMLGTNVQVEEATPDGRIDMVVKTERTIYIFELKYNQSAEAAIKQIEQKDYARIFADDNRRIVKVGLNFSEDRRSLESWKVER